MFVLVEYCGIFDWDCGFLFLDLEIKIWFEDYVDLVFGFLFFVCFSWVMCKLYLIKGGVFVYW